MLQNLRRQVCQPCGLADEPVRYRFGLGDFSDRCHLDALKLLPPSSCPAEGLEEVRILRSRLLFDRVLWQQDFGPPFAAGDAEGSDHPDTVVRGSHRTVSIFIPICRIACVPAAP